MGETVGWQWLEHREIQGQRLKQVICSEVLPQNLQRTSLPYIDHRGRPGRLTSCSGITVSSASNTIPGSGEGRQVGCPTPPLPSHQPQSLVALPHQHKWLKSWSPQSFIQPRGLQKGQHKCHQQVCWPQLGASSTQTCRVFGECILW